MRGTRTLSTVAAVAVICAFGCGCSFFHLLSHEPVDLGGKWVAKGQPLVMTFKKDLTYEIDQNGDGVPDITGTYRQSLHWVYLRQDKPAGVATCDEDGAYEYTIKGKSITFASMGDSCGERIQLLSNAWERPPRVDPVEPVKAPAPPPKINWTW